VQILPVACVYYYYYDDGGDGGDGPHTVCLGGKQKYASSGMKGNVGTVCQIRAQAGFPGFPSAEGDV